MQTVCGRGGTGRRATLRSLWPQGRGSSSLLDRTNFSPYPDDRPVGRRYRRMLDAAADLRNTLPKNKNIRGRASATRAGPAARGKETPHARDLAVSYRGGSARSFSAHFRRTRPRGQAGPLRRSRLPAGFGPARGCARAGDCKQPRNQPAGRTEMARGPSARYGQAPRAAARTDGRGDVARSGHR